MIYKKNDKTTNEMWKYHSQNVNKPDEKTHTRGRDVDIHQFTSQVIMVLLLGEWRQPTTTTTISTRQCNNILLRAKATKVPRIRRNAKNYNISVFIFGAGEFDDDCCWCCSCCCCGFVLLIRFDCSSARRSISFHHQNFAITTDSHYFRLVVFCSAPILVLSMSHRIK